MKCIFRQIKQKKKLVYGQIVKNANYLDFVIQIAGILLYSHFGIKFDNKLVC